MIFIALILSLIAPLALLRMLRSAGLRQLRTDCAAIFALLEELSTAGLRQLRSARAASFALLEELSTAGLRQLRSARKASFALLAQRALHCAKRFALLALPALLCVACSDLREQPELQAEPVGDTYLTISLRYDSGKPSRAGRADDDGEVIPGNGHPDAVYPNDDVYAYGSEAENTIKSITIFVGDLDALPATADQKDNADNIVVRNGGKYYTATRITLAKDQIFRIGNNPFSYTTLVTGDNAKRDKVVYVGANLSQDQVDYICANGVGEAYNFQNISMSVVNEITSETYGFAMFCTKPQYYHFEPGATNAIDFSLRRIMAKILVTVKTEDPDADHPHAVVETSTNEVPSFQVRIEEIEFVANTLNKSTYFFQNVDGNTVKDPNWDSFTNANNFIYHPLHSWYNYIDNFMPALKHEDNRMPTETANADQNGWYYEGIYVPENCFNSTLAPNLTSMNDEEKAEAQAEFADLAERNATHVVIRALITPMKLQVNRGLAQYIKEDVRNDAIGDKMLDLQNNLQDGEDIFEYVCTNRTESDLITRYSLDYEGFNGLVAESFLMKDGKFYCFSAAKMESQHTEYLAHKGQADETEYTDYERGKRNNVKFEGYTIFTDGYAHYKVFLDDKLNANQSTTDWSKSQIYRNTYYILTIDKFKGVSGGIDPTEEMIEVHTQTIDHLDSWHSTGTILSDGDQNADFPMDDEP